MSDEASLEATLELKRVQGMDMTLELKRVPEMDMTLGPRSAMMKALT